MSPAEAPPKQLSNPELHWFFYEPAEGESESIGTWSPAGRDQSQVVYASFHTTDNRETAELWLAELAAGRRPQTSENES